MESYNRSIRLLFVYPEWALEMDIRKNGFRTAQAFLKTSLISAAVKVEPTANISKTRAFGPVRRPPGIIPLCKRAFPPTGESNALRSPE